MLYKQNFTLSQIFAEDTMKGRLLNLINIRDLRTNDNDKVNKAPFNTVKNLAFLIANKSASQVFESFVSTEIGDNLDIAGKIDNLDVALDQITLDLASQVGTLSTLANNINIINEAVVESLRIQHATGKEPKLYLKENSLQEIRNKSPKEMSEFLQEILENIYYNESFKNVQSSLDLESNSIDGKKYSWIKYKDRKAKWEYKVGKFK